ncbi:hypothetical protein [Actinomadura sp. 6N118]|uniref:hypothetical protein n=1 Tax=Actinomadura sp. 6N118 TaxID=3375151 RepID=UPI00379CCDE3
MPPTQDASSATVASTSPPNAYGCLLPSAGLHALGLLLALSPLHWTVVGYLLVLVGAVLLAITCGLGRLPADSPERPRALRAANHHVVYGLVATAATVVVGVADTGSTAIWMGYLCLVPVGTGLYTRAQLIGRDRVLPAAVANVLVVAVPVLCVVGAPFAHGTGRSPAIALLLMIAGVGLLGVSLLCVTSRALVPGAVLLFLVAALTLNNFTSGLQAWLNVAGQSQDCRLLDTTTFRPRAASPDAVHHYQCGERRVDYEQASGVTPISDAKLVVDRTGITDRALPGEETPGWRGVLWLVNLGAIVAALGAVVLLGRNRQRNAAQPQT